ncbi:hypothetical protein KTT_05150 [Tengunoibacter tsumagoiensis]|uniref:Protein kinase domain-containing protein n=1 Tax=Tengunoibacter tsumagoiensis TaxID=2014871 RepID=A0A401ZV37_9CHLR|nr:hypothetical protein KTT_05150 [Tengunoibacter tsumagoiensis]
MKQRYRILRTIGKGGMGAVYEAEDLQLGNRLVAVKEMSEQNLSPQELARAADNFKQEAHLLAKLQHPNLPSIHDYFTESGRWYLVMNFIPGQTLSDYLAKKGGKLPLVEALRIGITLCTVLEYLHEQRPPIIFRDLKPSNIIRSPQGEIYLIDFGIARHFKPGQAQDTMAFGSAGYAAPEQYGRSQTTPRSDIYSLGAILYQLLSGWNPADSPFRFSPLASHRVRVPADLEALLLRMVEVDDQKRPASMLIVRQELQRILRESSQNSTTPIRLTGPSPASPASPTRPATARSTRSQAQAMRQPAAHLLHVPDVRRSARRVRSRFAGWRHRNAPHQPVRIMQGVQRARAVVLKPQTSFWNFTPRQIFATLVAALLCATITVWLDRTHFPTWYTLYVGIVPFRISIFLLLDMVTLSIALFCGAKWGPWSGLLSGGVGTLLGDYVVYSGQSFGWPWDLRVALAGLLVGLFLLRARPQRALFNSAILFAILLSTAFASYTDMWLQRQTSLVATTIFIIYSTISVISCLILLSLPFYSYKKSRKNP